MNTISHAKGKLYDFLLDIYYISTKKDRIKQELQSLILKYGTTIWDNNLGQQFGTTIWDKSWTKFGTQIGDTQKVRQTDGRTDRHKT